MDKRKEMVLLMEEFARSGQSQKDFSASKGIGFHTFNYWFRKLKKEKEEAAGFSRVETGGGFSPSGGQLELVYPNGVKLRTDLNDLSLLSRLIRLY